ncbi:hypothetical protein HAZT_HAZT000395 [Hyalella azteca]|uniref:Uncharacterized protein n=1 Tax=Hyalella azteca TaxID=294128 RepID=A0A6A0GRX2_HYAAZ|nr:hypothetical protein HAZT_HAZT000395 [Hyalella azteca]
MQQQKSEGYRRAYSLRKTPLYNSVLWAPDNEPLCTVDSKKSHWYVDNDLGENHDVVLLCTECHQPSNQRDGVLPYQLADQHDATIGNSADVKVITDGNLKVIKEQYRIALAGTEGTVDVPYVPNLRRPQGRSDAFCNDSGTVCDSGHVHDDGETEGDDGETKDHAEESEENDGQTDGNNEESEDDNVVTEDDNGDTEYHDKIQ